MMKLPADSGPMPLNFSVTQHAHRVKHNPAKRKSSKHHFHTFHLARTLQFQQWDFSPFARRLHARLNAEYGD
jgi:hypothetical protein